MFSYFKKEAPKALKAPLDKRGRKEGKMLLRGVRKFLRYNKDLISGDRMAEIEGKRKKFSHTLEDQSASRSEMEEGSES